MTWEAQNYVLHSDVMKEVAAMYVKAIHHVLTDVSGAEANTAPSIARKSRTGYRQAKAMEREKARARKVQGGDQLGFQQGAWRAQGPMKNQCGLGWLLITLVLRPKGA